MEEKEWGILSKENHCGCGQAQAPRLRSFGSRVQDVSRFGPSPFLSSSLCRYGGCPVPLALSKFIIYGTAYSDNVLNAQPSDSPIHPFSPVTGTNNPIGLQPERSAGDRGRVGRTWLSHGALLGRSWCGKRTLFLVSICKSFKVPLSKFSFPVAPFFAVVVA